MNRTAKTLLGAAILALQVSAPTLAWANNGVQGSNTSDSANAQSGDAGTTNSTTFQGGPASNGGGSSAFYVGDTHARHDQSAKAQSGDAVASSQVGGIAGDGTNLQMNANSSDADAYSHNVDASNTATLNLGSYATNGGTALHTGDMEFIGDQTAATTSGDALAASQVTGVVGNGGHTIQLNLNSDDADAGDSEGSNDSASNELTIRFGAQADDGTATMTGHTAGSASQDAEAASGDAVAHSQVTGVVGDGDSVIQKNLNALTESSTNSADAFAGRVNVDNTGTAVAGPQADESSAMQEGDNVVDFAQGLAAQSGDAVAGSQIDGFSVNSTLAYQSNLESDDSTATSGLIDTDNDLSLEAGPQSALGTAVQAGSNWIDSTQSGAIATGDAVAGSQVAGVVVSGGDTTIQTGLVSDGADATTGSFTVDSNDLELDAGPMALGLQGTRTASQVGDNVGTTDQEAGFLGGDAIAAGQITGVVASRSDIAIQKNANVDGATASGGGVDGSTNAINDMTQQSVSLDPDSFGIHIGPGAYGSGSSATQSNERANRFHGTQLAGLETGDAIAGGQVSGTVANRDDISLQMNLVSASDNANAGDIEVYDGVNIAEFIFAGPSAIGDNTSAIQEGRSEITLDQVASSSTGDAVAGGQIAGTASNPSRITGQLNLDSDNSDSVSGDAENTNVIDQVRVGATAGTGSGGTATAAGGTYSANLGQAGEVETGDGVAGSQVLGAVNSGNKTTVQSTVNVEDATVTADEANSSNDMRDMFIGATAFANGEGNVSAMLDGSATLIFDQAGKASLGDAVAGSLVVGSVNTDSTIQVNLDSTDDTADSGRAETDNLASGNVGPVAIGGSTNTTVGHVGNATVVGGQVAESGTGDAVSGGQVIGVAGWSASTQSTDASVATAGTDSISGTSSAGS